MDHYCQSIIQNGTLNCKVSAIFTGNGLNLTIFQKEEAWSTEVPEEELTVRATTHQTRFEEYYQNLKKHIKDCPNDVKVEFKQGEFSINLLLKNNMKMLFFHCVLQKVDFATNAMNLVDALYEKNVQYHKELDILNSQYSTFKTTYNSIEAKMDEFLKRKKSDDRSLYNKFIGILNEKKRHIQHLNDLLIAFRQGRPTVNPPTAQPKRKRNSDQASTKNAKKVTMIKQEESSSESDECSSRDNNYNTDDEDNNINKVDNTKDRDNLSPVPSTSKVTDRNVEDVLHDAPTQEFIFPKRLRSENNFGFDRVFSKAKVEEQKSCTQSEKVACGKDNGTNRPVVNYNTQDLLDSL